MFTVIIPTLLIIVRSTWLKMPDMMSQFGTLIGKIVGSNYPGRLSEWGITCAIYSLRIVWSLEFPRLVLDKGTRSKHPACMEQDLMLRHWIQA